MQWSKFLVFVLVVATLTYANPVPTGTTTVRSRTQIGDTITQLTNQLMETNATSPDIITLDTRTPPKIKQHVKKKIKTPAIEVSHAGVAIPVDEDQVLLEETTKKLNFYKVEKPTTNSGLSTWILLSGQTTAKPSSRKPIVKTNEGQNATAIIDHNKIIKPIFKKRGTTSTTTRKPTNNSRGTTTSTTKLTKVKASILNNAKKTLTTTPISITSTTESVATTLLDISTLPIEAKEGETDLTPDNKKARRPATIKRKKNKNRRRRPSEKLDGASTKLTKPSKSKEKPIGTQLYHYLSREIMPTVGVGLAGLMVAAGLASYFLYPFGAARRSYEVDRRDKEFYHYTDEYSGGIAEEEAIGKVIAGMPSNSLYGNSYKTPTSRHSFGNRRGEQEDGATPATVPEHGPRKLRKRRQLLTEANDLENEIDGFGSTTHLNIDTATTTETITPIQPPKASLFSFIKEIIHLKLDLGLHFLKQASQAVNQYVTKVQKRLDQYHQNKTLLKLN